MKRIPVIMIASLFVIGIPAITQSDPVPKKNGNKYVLYEERINPEKPDVPLNKNDAFQKVQKRRVQEKR